MTKFLVSSLVAFLLAAGTATPGMCGGGVTGTKILKITDNTSTGVVLVLTSATSIGGAPACATNSTAQFAFQITALQGPTTPAMLLLTSAAATGTRVRLDGAGTCTVASNTEDLLDVYYGD